MGILWLFDTCGWILAPLIWAAGLVAIFLCIRATRQTGSPRYQRIALRFSFLPFVLGIVGAVVGLVLWQTTNQRAIETSEVLYALGKVCLAGLVVTAIPLAWALYLGRARPSVA